MINNLFNIGQMVYQYGTEPKYSTKRLLSTPSFYIGKINNIVKSDVIVKLPNNKYITIPKEKFYG